MNPRTFSLGLGLIMLTALCGCEQQLNTTDANTASQQFRCNTGATFSFTRNGDSAEIVLDRDTYTLSGERAASGAKYSNESMAFWGKGDDAMLMINNETWQCHRSD